MRHRTKTWGRLKTKNWPAWLKGLCQGHHNQASQGPDSSGDLWGSMIFNMFISDLANGTECSFSSFTQQKNRNAQNTRTCDDTQSAWKRWRNGQQSCAAQREVQSPVPVEEQPHAREPHAWKPNTRRSFAEEDLKLKQAEQQPGRCTCKGHQHLGCTRTVLPALWKWWSFLSCKF